MSSFPFNVRVHSPELIESYLLSLPSHGEPRTLHMAAYAQCAHCKKGMPRGELKSCGRCQEVIFLSKVPFTVHAHTLRTASPRIVRKNVKRATGKYIFLYSAFLLFNMSSAGVRVIKNNVTVTLPKDLARRISLKNLLNALSPCLQSWSFFHSTPFSR